MVTRRFWPLVGGAEMVMANLARQFRQQGAESTIVTAQWQPDWPRDFVHREVPVVRLPQPRTRGWGTWRYIRQLSRWLRDHQDEFDLVFVSMLKHSAYAAISVGQTLKQPVVLRAEGAGPTGDCQWQQTARFGRRIQDHCRRAAAVLAPSQQVHEELLELGYAPDRLHHVANGVALGPAPTADNRRAARQALGDTSLELRLEPEQKLVVFTGRLDRNKGLFDLVDAWRDVASQQPEARLWLIGEGPDSDEIRRRIFEQQLDGKILMPGAFDEVDQSLQAADLFVFPSYAEGLSLSLLEAMAHRLPVVASDIPGNQQLLDDQLHGQLVPCRDPAALARAILDSLQHTTVAADMAMAAYQRVVQHYSLQRMATDHLELFQQLVDQSQSAGQ